MKLYLQTPKKLLKYTTEYCDGYAVPNNKYLKDMGKLNKPHISLDNITVLSYTNRNLIPCAEDHVYLHSDLDAVKHGWRFDLALSIREKYPDSKFSLLGISTSLDEVKIFNEVIGCENLITWWPIAIGISGRDLDEEWPQLTPPSPEENESDIVSKAWLTHILSKFYMKVKEL